MRITIAGDFATTYRGEEAIKNRSAFSSEIVNILKESDVSIINLESPVADSSCHPIEKVGPNLKMNRDAISYLKESGCDVVTLANNHFFDYGADGVRQTIESLIDNDIMFVGGGRTQEELRQVLYLEKENQKVAILNYCEAEFSVRDGIGSNHIDPINAFNDICEAKRNANFVIVITHGGHEGFNLPSPRMQKLYRFFIDAGANLVVNHHQHCFSGYENYHNGNIFYGLGNFFFDSDYKNYELRKWHRGLLLQISIKDGLVSFTLLPYIQCFGDRAVVMLANGNNVKSFFEDLREINEIISNERSLKEANSKRYTLKNKNAGIVLTPYSNRYLRYLCKRHIIPSFLGRNRILQLYNVVFCESHNEMLKSFIKERSKAEKK